MPAYLIKYHRPTGALEVTEYESLIEGTALVMNWIK